MALELSLLAGAMQIGEVARLTSLSIDAIRFYERGALIPKPPRTSGRFRLYSEKDVERLSFIKEMQSLGFSLREIRQLIGLREHDRSACHEVRDLLEAKLKKVRSKIRELTALERELAIDFGWCNRELNKRKIRAPKNCPILSSFGAKTNGQKRRVLC